MSTYTLDLLFLAPPEDALAGPAVSHVSVKTWHKGGYEIEDEPSLLTPQCMGPSEIDHQINRLKDELEVIRTKAHKKYAAYRRLEERRFRKRATGPE
jgi:hypothetical protein